MWEEKVGALLQRAAAWLHLTHTVTQSSATHVRVRTHTHTHLRTCRQGDTPDFHASAPGTTQHLHIHPQSRTAKHDRHLDLVFVVSRKVSAPKNRGWGGGESGHLHCLGVSDHKPEGNSERQSRDGAPAESALTGLR